jgi:cytochrome c553
MLGSSLVGSSLAHADIIITAGMEPWETCAECHNLDGISAMPKFPKLAGQRPGYIQKQVRDFRLGHRHNDGGQMAAIAGDINDKDLAKSAEYFAGLPPPLPNAAPSAAPEDLRRGAALYRDGDGTAGIEKCGTCHEADSTRTDAPFLTAQHAGYLEKQLRDWRSGARGNDVSQAMPAIAGKLSDRDIAALAAFLASQPRIQSNVSQAQ